MPKHSDETYKLLSALMTVEKDAKERAKRYRDEIGKKPFSNWSQEKHDKHHEQQAIEAEDGAHYCFIRYMTIDPD